MADTKITLQESQIPSPWYKVLADMPEPPGPPLHPGTKAPMGPDDLAPLFPMSLIGQEVSSDRWIDIPARFRTSTGSGGPRREGCDRRTDQAREEGVERVILFILSGHGNFDMAAYDAYLAGQLEDVDYPQESIEAAMADIPEVQPVA